MQVLKVFLWCVIPQETTLQGSKSDKEDGHEISKEEIQYQTGVKRMPRMMVKRGPKDDCDRACKTICPERRELREESNSDTS